MELWSQRIVLMASLGLIGALAFGVTFWLPNITLPKHLSMHHTRVSTKASTDANGDKHVANLPGNLVHVESAANTNANGDKDVAKLPLHHDAKALSDKALAMLRLRPGFKDCPFRKKFGEWSRYCSCEAHLEVAGHAAKICHIPLYGVILTLYDPIFSVMGQRMGWELGERREYNDILAVPSLGRDSVALDIGANLGDVSILLAKLNPGAHVFTFEANPVTFKFLQRNIEANGVEAQVTIRNVGIMASDGLNLTVYNCHGNNIGGTTLKDYARRKYRNKLNECSSQKVPTISFPTILKTFGIVTVDLLKMDCEGCEEDVIPQIPAGIVLKRSGECHPRAYDDPKFIDVCHSYLGNHDR